MRAMRRGWLLFSVPLLLVSLTAEAHITMLYPPNRYGDEQKFPPCGLPGGERTDRVTVLEPGETITVVWDEPIPHPSHFRISFDEDGDDAFADPEAPDDYYTNDAVLIDEIPDDPSHEYAIDVTLPDIECDNCTLQLIQVMYDKPPFGNGNDMYYNCADLILREGGADETDPPPGGGEPGMMPGASGGCSAGGGAPGALAWLFLAAVLVLGPSRGSGSRPRRWRHRRRSGPRPGRRPGASPRAPRG